MQLRFIKASPCHNTTVFIFAEVPRAERVRVAQLALSKDYLSAEQVGFFVAPRTANAAARVEMAGDEFCGNATLALAARLVHIGMREPGRFFAVEMSGIKQPLTVSATPTDVSGHYRASAIMPKIPAKSIQAITPKRVLTGRNAGMVFLPGMDTLLVDDFSLSDDEFDRTQSDMKSWSLNVAGAVVAYQRVEGQRYRIKPYVDVRATGSRMYEQACGSGSWGLALWLASRDKRRRRFIFEQPCGEAIEVALTRDGAAMLTTDVYFPCEGAINV